MVTSICKLLENIIAHNDVKALDHIFIFSCIWCIGGGFTEKDGKNYKAEFSNWWKDKFKASSRGPKGKSIFDFYVDIENSQWEEWNKLAQNIGNIDTSKSITNYTIPTVETISAQFLLKQFIQINHCCIMVGMAGCGKT